ncbi:hybrid sensor histidine kinase/response regulator [Bacteroides graminisolvens]|uniref:hybrid sensor histidine kinase/response regulator n=1 Tax=Bacteroides graminisolvens TaxID=477666 RepID=UPI00240987D8|nr:hybrid sensor histidine kinase/response regulator [Bacteroides graminisolvens]
MENEEHLLRKKRILVYRSFEKLLDLSFSDSFFYQIGDEQYKIYQAKTAKAIASLEKLRACSTDTQQAMRIDTICLLLIEKQLQIPLMISLQSDFVRLDSLMEDRIHTIANQTEQLPRNMEKPSKKQGFFARIFRKENKKNEYAKQIKSKKEEQISAGKVPSMLRSLHREFHAQSTEHRHLIELHADSLDARNMRLNTKFSQLLHHLEQTALQLEKDAKNMARVRDKSFCYISCLSMVTVLLSAVFFCIVVRDIRRRQAIQLQMEKLNRKNEMLLKARKDMMLAVSHDLRTPLTAISGYAELIPSERQKDKRTRYSQIIRQSAGSMIELLNSLLRFYRLDAGKEHIDNHPFRLKNLAETLITTFALLAEKKKIAFSSEYTGDDVMVTGDPEKILQIIDNLLSNAIKFTQAGEVNMHLHYSDNLLIIKVRDTGTGMSDSQIQQIFQPFERLGNAGIQEGFGLGLAITLAMVELLSGKIRVESKEGKGSLFTVHLPLFTTEEQNLLLKADKSRPLPGNLRILIIDDDPILLAMTTDMLSHNKISCKGCRNVHDLMEVLREHTYDLLITDIKMPEMNGYQLLELLRCSNIGISRTIPVLAMTAYVDRNTEDFTEAGFAGCLLKPFSQAELLSVVQKSIERKQAGRIPRQADFSALFSYERNNKEMLSLFIRETGEKMVTLEKSINSSDIKTISSITHYLLPLWKLILEDNALKHLQQLLDISSGEMNKEIEQVTQDVIEQGYSIVRQAQIKMKEIENE